MSDKLKEIEMLARELCGYLDGDKPTKERPVLWCGQQIIALARDLGRETADNAKMPLKADKREELVDGLERIGRMADRIYARLSKKEYVIGNLDEVADIMRLSAKLTTSLGAAPGDVPESDEAKREPASLGNCPDCDGTGHVEPFDGCQFASCQTCGGTGCVDLEKTSLGAAGGAAQGDEVDIEKRIASLERMEIKSQFDLIWNEVSEYGRNYVELNNKLVVTDKAVAELSQDQRGYDKRLVAGEQFMGKLEKAVAELKVAVATPDLGGQTQEEHDKIEKLIKDVRQDIQEDDKTDESLPLTNAEFEQLIKYIPQPAESPASDTDTLDTESKPGT